MDPGEIRRWFRQALRKKQAVGILADMNLCDKRKILEILEEDMEAYSEEEIGIIRDMKSAGASSKKVAEKLGRNRKAVDAKWQQLKKEMQAGTAEKKAISNTPLTKQPKKIDTDQKKNNCPALGDMGDVKALLAAPVVSLEKNYIDGTIRYTIEFLGGLWDVVFRRSDKE